MGKHSVLTVAALLLVAAVAVAVVGPIRGDNAAAVVSAAPASARSNVEPTIFLRAVGETQGDLRGGSTQTRCADCMEIYGFAHEVISPRDAASGLPTGKRQHKPIVVTKRVDQATPLLYSALTNNENITDFQLLFFRDRETTPFYTIDLVNASIAGIDAETDPELGTEVREHVSFTYQKIVWTWADGGITAEDDWETPVA